MNLTHLPPDLLIQTVLDCHFLELIQLCVQNTYLYQVLCQNEDFWRRLYLHHFEPPQKIPLVWRELYHQKCEDYLSIVISKKMTFIPDAFDIKTISAGRHNLFINEDGECFFFDRTYSLSQISIQPLSLKNIKSISSNETHSLILVGEEGEEDGQVYSFGFNEYGRLGLGDYLHRGEPELIQLPENIKIKQISAGGKHSLILNESGQVYSFGYNGCGQLGLGLNRNQHRNIPSRIMGIPKIKQISAGRNHNLLLDEHDQVWGFGSTVQGELGTINFDVMKVPTLIPFFQETPDIQIKEVVAGYDASFILTDDGRGYAFGVNVNPFVPGMKRRYEPGLISFDNIRSVSSGRTLHVILTQDNMFHIVYEDWCLREPPNQIAEFTVVPDGDIKDFSVGDDYILILTRPYTLFSTIETLLEKNFIRDRKILSSDNDQTLMEYTDLQGDVYRIMVRYDPDTDQIFPLS